MIEIKLRIPDRAAVGEVIEVRTLALAPAIDEEVFGPDGLPVRIFRAFRCTFEGREVLRADLQPGMARDLALTFPFRVPGSGTLTLVWVLESGEELVRRHAVGV